jgi:toxin FitB
LRLVLDTGVLIAADALPADADVAVASVTFAELAYGVRAAVDPLEQALRQERLERLREQMGPGLPFDDRAASAFGTLCGLVLAAGRSPRARALDLMIAATAYANEAALYTRDPRDFVGVEPLVQILTP